MYDYQVLLHKEWYMFRNPNNSLVKIYHCLLTNNGLEVSDVSILFQLWLLLG